jgi:hypothetical protein
MDRCRRTDAGAARGRPNIRATSRKVAAGGCPKWSLQARPLAAPCSGSGEHRTKQATVWLGHGLRVRSITPKSAPVNRGDHAEATAVMRHAARANVPGSSAEPMMDYFAAGVRDVGSAPFRGGRFRRAKIEKTAIGVSRPPGGAARGGLARITAGEALAGCALVRNGGRPEAAGAGRLRGRA